MPERRDLYLTTYHSAVNSQNPAYSRELIATDLTEDEAIKTIFEFMRARGWWSNGFIRSWVVEERYRYDFGSYRQFFDWMKGDKNE